MGYRSARRIHVLLMSWLTLIFLTAWLPMLRGAMDGASYEWGAALLGAQFSGAGTSGDYWFVVVKAAIRRFAGDDLLRAKYYDFDPDYLLELEAEVTHFGVVEG